MATPYKRNTARSFRVGIFELTLICLVSTGCMAACFEPAHAPADASTFEDAASVADDAGPISFHDAAVDLRSDASLLPELPVRVCNREGWACPLEYGQALVVATHVSAASRVAGWQTITQSVTPRAQLEGDAQALMVEVFEVSGDLVVCDGNCARGSVALNEVLGAVEDFLSHNTASVVTLLMEAHVPSDTLGAALLDSDVGAKLYAHRDGDAWPTIGQLVDADDRLVVFASTSTAVILDETDAGSVADDAEEFAFLHPLDRWVKRTRDDANILGMIDCRVVAGNANAPFLLLHLHVTEPESDTSTPVLSMLANEESVVLSRVESCTTLHGRTPSFIALDFFESGAALRVIQNYNRTRTW